MNGGADGDHTGVSVLEKSNIPAIQDGLLFGIVLVGGLYLSRETHKILAPIL